MRNLPDSNTPLADRLVCFLPESSRPRKGAGFFKANL